jgi:hypothetical protein
MSDADREDRKPGTLDRYGDVVINDQFSLRLDKVDGRAWLIVDTAAGGAITEVPRHLANTPEQAVAVMLFGNEQYQLGFRHGDRNGWRRHRLLIKAHIREIMGED